jgi:hypothetical protein
MAREPNPRRTTMPEQEMREAEEALELHFETLIEVWHRGTDDIAEAIGLSRSEYAAFVEKRETPLQLILKRKRATTTEEEHDER